MSRKPPQLKPSRSSRPPARRSTSRWRHLYASNRWRVASERFRASPEGALCAACKALGIIRPSECVDHIVPHNGDLGLFWDPANWQPLCNSHHAAKTRADDFEQKTGRRRLRRGCDATGRPIDENHPWNAR